MLSATSYQQHLDPPSAKWSYIAPMSGLYFVLFLAHLSFATVPSEPWSAIILDAQKSAVAKNRKEATAKIIASLNHDKWGSKGKAKLLDSLKTMGEVFFTDKGQRIYETGQSLAYENPESALNSFREALLLEDSNVTILLGIARAQLARKDCVAAAKTLKTVSELNPFDEALRFLEGKTFLCRDDVASALEKLKGDASEDVVKMVTLASALHENGNDKEALSLLQKTVTKDPFYPEAHYWLWKLTELGGDGAEEHAQRYAVLCKNLNTRTRRKYLNEPRLCAQAQEIDEAIKNAQKNNEP
jgi:tetratricopeptide (TPR) repeat protein